MEKLRVSREQADRQRLLVEYLNDREQSWQLTADGFSAHDADKLKEGAAKRADADRIAARLRR